MLGPVVAAGAEAAADGAVHAEVVGKVGGRAHGADGRRVGKPARQQTGKSAVQTIRQPLREAPQTGPPECLPGGGWAPGRRLDSGQSGSLTSAARGGRVWGLGSGVWAEEVQGSAEASTSAKATADRTARQAKVGGIQANPT